MNNIKLQGVNLGGWLVLEKWITPSLFAGTDAMDEYNLHKVTTDSVISKIQTHYETFITESDFIFLTKNNINALRIPVGYWIFGDIDNFPATVNYLDKAFQLAAKYNMHILIDLHAVMGSQNGWDHSAKAGDINWHKDNKNVDQTLNVIKLLAKRYSKSESLWGIELVNEPHPSIPIDFLNGFYLDGYEVVREICTDNVAVVFSDSYRPWNWHGFMTDPKYKNVIMDMHLYQCFSPIDKKMLVLEHFEKTKNEWGNLTDTIIKDRQVICGEWSMVLDGESLIYLTNLEKDHAIKQYCHEQLKIFDKLTASFYWTYKTENYSWWSFTYNLDKFHL